MLDFSQSYFALFSLPEQFDINSSQLATAFRELQANYHPDRYVNANDQQRRQAMQCTGFINEANETLKSNRLRARYLLVLRGVDFDDEIDTTSDAMFLMHQMEMREELEEASQAEEPLEATEAIDKRVKHEIQQLEAEFQSCIEKDDLVNAKEAVLKMKFYERLSQEVKSLTEKLEDQLYLT